MVSPFAAHHVQDKPLPVAPTDKQQASRPGSSSNSQAGLEISAKGSPLHASASEPYVHAGSESGSNRIRARLLEQTGRSASAGLLVMASKPRQKTELSTLSQPEQTQGLQEVQSCSVQLCHIVILSNGLFVMTGKAKWKDYTA